MKLFRGILILSLCLVMVMAVAACDTAETEAIKIGYVEWACATASSYLVKNIIIHELGLDAELVALDAGVMWQSIGTGDIDIMACAWLPGTHGGYYAEVETSIVDMGPNYEGALVGLVVPSYVNVNSIAELNDFADHFGGTIVGIDAGAGIMSATHSAIDVYGLDFELQESSDAAMTAALRSALDDQEWIVVTGWAPHWKFAYWDLKFLADPEGVYGGAETINTIVRTGFATDHPAVNAFLENFFMTAEQLGVLMGMMEEYRDPNDAAQAWIRGHRSIVDQWIGQ